MRGLRRALAVLVAMTCALSAHGFAPGGLPLGLRAHRGLQAAASARRPRVRPARPAAGAIAPVMMASAGGEASGFEKGDRVEVKWGGEWWLCDVIDLRGGAGAAAAVLVRFHNGGGGEADEEWVEASSGRLRRHRDVAAAGGSGGQVYTDAERECADASSDADFWKADETAPDPDLWELLEEVHKGRVRVGARLLDLGAGAQTAFPVDFPLKVATGVGAVPEHLQLNALLTDWQVQDLNEDATLPFISGSFDAVLCSHMAPYLRRPEEVIREAARVVHRNGTLVVSWTSTVAAGKAVVGWQQLTDTQQVELVKGLLLGAGMHESSMRVDVSGPTSGPKLYIVSGSPAPKNLAQKSSPVVLDVVDTRTLMHLSKQKQSEQRERDNQKEQDLKPFRVRIVSPPPEKELADNYFFHPRTHCGDKITINDENYVVSRVRFLYEFSGGRYKLDTKVLEVQHTGRFEMNQKLQGLLPRR